MPFVSSALLVRKKVFFLPIWLENACVAFFLSVYLTEDRIDTGHEDGPDTKGGILLKMYNNLNFVNTAICLSCTYHHLFLEILSFFIVCVCVCVFYSIQSFIWGEAVIPMYILYDNYYL